MDIFVFNEGSFCVIKTIMKSELIRMYRNDVYILHKTTYPELEPLNDIYANVNFHKTWNFIVTVKSFRKLIQ